MLIIRLPSLTPNKFSKLIRVRGGNGPVARETKDPVVACLKKSKGFWLWWRVIVPYVKRDMWAEPKQRTG